MPSLKHIWRLASIKQSAGRAGPHAEKNPEEKKVVGYGQFEIPLFDPLQRAIRSVLQIAFAHTRLKNTIFLAYFFVRSVVFLVKNRVVMYGGSTKLQTCCRRPWCGKHQCPAPRRPQTLCCPSGRGRSGTGQGPVHHKPFA